MAVSWLLDGLTDLHPFIQRTNEVMEHTCDSLYIVIFMLLVFPDDGIINGNKRFKTCSVIYSQTSHAQLRICRIVLHCIVLQISLDLMVLLTMHVLKVNTTAVSTRINEWS